MALVATSHAVPLQVNAAQSRTNIYSSSHDMGTHTGVQPASQSLNGVNTTEMNGSSAGDTMVAGPVAPNAAGAAINMTLSLLYDCGTERMWPRCTTHCTRATAAR